MKSLMSCLFVVATASAPALANPDFVSSSPQGRSLAASSGTRAMTPQDDVIFGLDSASLSESAVDQLDTVARWLKRNPGQRIVLEGYTDFIGRAAYNEDLATRRAQSVRWHLMKRGIPSDRIVVLVYGEVGADLSGQKLDRRVVLYASAMPVRQIVRASIDNKYALSAMWTERGALFTEARGVIATR